MTYTLPAWQDSPSTATPIDATNLLLLNTAITDLDARAPATGVITQLGMTVTAVKTANYTASPNEIVPVDSTSTSPTITFPTAPPDRTRVAVKHVVRPGTNVVNLALGGSDKFNIVGGATTGSLTLLNQGGLFQYVASTSVWIAISTDMPLSQLDSRYATQAVATTSTAGLMSAADKLKLNGAPVALTDGATINTDASLGSHFRVTLGGNRTMANPTNLTDGQKLLYEVIQDATGSRTLTWGSKFTWGTTITVPTLTTTANKRDFVGVVYNSTADKLYGLAAALGY